MKIKENITLYCCDFCNKRYLRKKACLEHEQFCNDNPRNWHQCWDCAHLLKEVTKLENEHGIYGHETIFRCTNKDRKTNADGMYSNIAERRMLRNKDMQASLQNCERMPVDCDFFGFKEYPEIRTKTITEENHE